MHYIISTAMPPSTTDPMSTAETAEGSAQRGNLHDQKEMLCDFHRIASAKKRFPCREAKHVVANSYLGSASEQPA